MKGVTHAALALPAPPEVVVNHRPSWISRKPRASRPPSSRPSQTPPAPTTTPLPKSSPPAPSVEAQPAVPEPAPPPVEPDPALLAEIDSLRADNAALQSRIAEMAVTMARVRRDVLEASEPELVQLALSIAGRVVGRELASDPSLVVDWAREAIQALASKDEVVIALAKDIEPLVPPQAWAEHRALLDPELPDGVIEVRSNGAVVAAGAQARLDSVALALGVVEP